MIESLLSDTAIKLQSGNNELPFTTSEGIGLPDQDALRARLDSYFADQGGLVGLPRQFRMDTNWLIDELYSGTQFSGIQKSIVTGATEAIIVTDGSRPVLFVENDKLITKGKPDGPFVQAIAKAEAALESMALSVGRIETDDRSAPTGLDVYYDGSAFLVANDLVMTNRHVAQRIVNEPYGDGPFTLKYDYWINFDGQINGSTTKRVRISDVAFVGPGFIGEGGDFTRLDMALLRLGAAAETHYVAPQPLRLSGRTLIKDTKVAVLGFPAPPAIYTGSGIPPTNTELEAVLQAVFDKRFGYKRCAAGAIRGEAGSDSSDTQKWIAEHDASTLGGNSGSPVIPLDTTDLSVAALHFFGRPRKANFAHVFDKISQTLNEFGIQLH